MNFRTLDLFGKADFRGWNKELPKPAEGIETVSKDGESLDCDAETVCANVF